MLISYLSKSIRNDFFGRPFIHWKSSPKNLWQRCFIKDLALESAGDLSAILETEFSLQKSPLVTEVSVRKFLENFLWKRSRFVYDLRATLNSKTKTAFSMDALPEAYELASKLHIY